MDWTMRCTVGGVTRRIPDKALLVSEIRGWERRRNAV
jgi:hypothetical protein